MKLDRINRQLAEHCLEITPGANGTWVLWQISEKTPVVLGIYTSPRWAYEKANRIVMGIPSEGYREPGQL